jgi:archaellum component FlaC
MDFTKIGKILATLEEGSVTPEQGALLIDGIVDILNKLRPQLKKWWFRVMLDGVKVSLMELKEHLEEIEE